MPNNVNKAIEISSAKIQFVSLVAKAANKRQFLITKSDGGNAQFSTYGKILKADADTHYVTGIVYEPLAEDADGNFMTAEEIRKAAHWFSKNGDKVDVQHSYEAVEGAMVVESYIAPCDLTIGDTPVVKGTWVMTVELENAELWDAVQKGSITGFSMGGVGKYSEEDVNLDELNKTAPAETGTPTDAPKKSVIKSLLAALGFDVVEKGEVADSYAESTKSSNFWNAWYALERVLCRWSYVADKYVFEADEATIREALVDFNTIITDVLTEKNIAKAISTAAPVNKAGKKISTANKKKLDDAYQILTDLRGAFEDADEGENNVEKENQNMTLDEVKKMVDEAVTAAVTKMAPPAADPSAPVAPEATPAPATEPLTAESVQKMINESVKKALDEHGTATPVQSEPAAETLTPEVVQKMIADSLTPILKARGLPSNLNGEPQQQVEKSEDIFSGLFI